VTGNITNITGSNNIVNKTAAKADNTKLIHFNWISNQLL
jgi:hypothetical protein